MKVDRVPDEAFWVAEVCERIVTQAGGGWKGRPADFREIIRTEFDKTERTAPGFPRTMKEWRTAFQRSAPETFDVYVPDVRGRLWYIVPKGSVQTVDVIVAQSLEPVARIPITDEYFPDDHTAILREAARGNGKTTEYNERTHRKAHETRQFVDLNIYTNGIKPPNPLRSMTEYDQYIDISVFPNGVRIAAPGEVPLGAARNYFPNGRNRFVTGWGDIMVALKEEFGVPAGTPCYARESRFWWFAFDTTRENADHWVDVICEVYERFALRPYCALWAKRAPLVVTVGLY